MTIRAYYFRVFTGFVILFAVHNSLAQGGSEGFENGTGNSTKSPFINSYTLNEDSSYLDNTIQRIKEHFDDLDVPYDNQTLRKVANGYFILTPLKKQDEILIIWSDHHFSESGVWMRSTIKFEDIDCAILGEKICGRVDATRKNMGRILTV